MNIVFQFGEFIGEDSSFLADLFIAIVGAFIGAGGAIWLYYRQTRDQKKKEEDNKTQIQKDKLRYLHYLLKDVIFSIEKFSEVISEFHEEIINKPIHIPQLKTLSTYNFDRIVNKLNQEDYYHAHVTLVEDENVSTIFSLVAYFYGSMTLVEQQHKEVFQYDLQRRKQFSEAVTILVNEMAESLRTFKTDNQKDDDNYKTLNEFILRYYKSLEPDPSDFVKIRNEFLTPLLETIYKINDSVEIINITKMTSTANKLLTPIILSNQSYANELKNLNNGLIKANDKLKYQITSLSSFLGSES